MNRFFFWWILVVSLASVSVATAQTIFTDHFSGGKSPRWRQVNDGQLPGRFQVRNGEYTLISSDPATSLPRSIVSSLQEENYYIQAQVRITPTQSNLAEASLIAYYTDSTHYYEFAFDSLQNYWSLGKVDKSGSSLLARGAAGAGQAVRKLGLFVNGKDIRVFLDGTMVAEKTDSAPLPPGSFGLGARGAEAEWLCVDVKVSNPQDFSYSFVSQTSDNKGEVSFQNTSFLLTSNSGAPIPGIRVYRIFRDGTSYFIFNDPRNMFSGRSGFLTEFEQGAKNQYKVTLIRTNAIQQSSHPYTSPQTDWLFAFLSRSARFLGHGVTVSLKETRTVLLQAGTFQVEGAPLGDSVFGSAGQQTEVVGLIFGKPQNTGNYSRFPSTTGKISNSNSLEAGFISVLPAPENSKFTIFNLKLTTGSQSTSISWIVQQDSRGMVIVQSADFPRESLRPGSVFTVPFTISNSGENAGPFVLYFLLSQNSSLALSDVRLKKISFNGLESRGKISSEADLTIPPNVKPGRYFIGTLLQTADPGTRVLNGTGTIRPVAVGDFPPNGQLEVTLTWNDDADLDLHLTDPFGETIHYFRPSSLSGGSLERDFECFETGEKTERISYSQGSAVFGDYLISVHYFRSCNSGKPVHWTVNVTSDGKSQSYEGTVNPGQYLRVGDFVR